MSNFSSFKILILPRREWNKFSYYSTGRPLDPVEVHEMGYLVLDNACLVQQNLWSTSDKRDISLYLAVCVFKGGVLEIS